MNHSTTFAILTSILLLLTSCGTTEPLQEKPQQDTVKQSTPPAQTTIPVIYIDDTPAKAPAEKTQEPVRTPPAPVDTKILVEKSRDLSPELRDLLTKADTELKSIKYIYIETPGNEGFDVYYVKGNKIRIELFEKNEYIIDDYFNAVYLDTQQKTAYGKCENRNRCISGPVDNTKRIYELSYDAYRTKTPYEWVKSIDYAEIMGNEVIAHKAVTKIQTEKNGKLTELWLDTRYGIPHKIRVTNTTGQKTYQFTDMIFNSLKDTDVEI